MIVGEKIMLRGLELSDLDVIMRYWNNLELRNLLAGADQGPVSFTEEEEWIRNKWKERQEKKGFYFAIETIADRKMIGTTALMAIDWTSRSATFGISIYDPVNWGKRYGRETTKLILEYAFNVLNLNRVELETLESNVRAQRCYRAVGFREVGRKRKARYVNGELRDEIIMDLLRDEWKPKLEPNNP
jgi:RimJ/RimL family protein N-acetyltransferase